MASKADLIRCFLSMPDGKPLTPTQYGRFRLILPYVEWTLKDRTQVMANRQYEPFLARSPSGDVFSLDPHWVTGIVKHRYLFDDVDHPLNTGEACSSLRSYMRVWIVGKRMAA
jgi:hypothetical protein